MCAQHTQFKTVCCCCVRKRIAPPPNPSYIKSFQVFLDMKPTINSQWPREALVPHVGNHGCVSLTTHVLHLGSRLWPATGAPARGGVRVRPTLAKVGRAKRQFLRISIRVLVKPGGLTETLVFMRHPGMCLRSRLGSVQD